MEEELLAPGVTSSWGQKDRKPKCWTKDCVYQATWSKKGYCCNKCKIEGKGAHGSRCDRKVIEQPETLKAGKVSKSEQEKPPWRREAEKKGGNTSSEPKRTRGDQCELRCQKKYFPGIIAGSKERMIECKKQRGKKKTYVQEGTNCECKKNMGYPNPFNTQEEKSEGSRKVKKVSTQSQTEDMEVPEVQEKERVMSEKSRNELLG